MSSMWRKSGMSLAVAPQTNLGIEYFVELIRAMKKVMCTTSSTPDYDRSLCRSSETCFPIGQTVKISAGRNFLILTGQEGIESLRIGMTTWPLQSSTGLVVINMLSDLHCIAFGSYPESRRSFWREECCSLYVKWTEGGQPAREARFHHQCPA